jgi:glycerol-3-phosphate O-acyltransferase/dihydroxyacetone phosphate acyltransferase
VYRRRVASSAPTPIYRLLRAGARVVLGLFYRRIEVTGLEHLEGDAPTILASTHPNSIVDPLLVGIFEDRQVTFCARDGLFRVPGFGSLLRAVGAVPIHRRSDHGAESQANDQAFAECRAVLARGGVISIFPEGKTHARLRVEPLKTGVARMALDAAEHDVRIVPVGLNYLVREAFRSDVHVAFGPPLRVRDLQTGWAGDPALADDPRAQVRGLTEALGESLRAIAVHVEDREDERLIAQVTAIVVELRHDEGLDDRSPAERTALVRRVIDAYRWLGEREPVRCARLRERVIRYVAERHRLGFAGVGTGLQKRGERSAISLGAPRGGGPTKALGREDRSLLGPLGLVLGAPIAAYGFAVTIVPYSLQALMLALGRPSRYRVALTKLIGGTLLFASWFALVIGLVFEAAGTAIAIAVGLSLIPGGLFAHRYAIDLRLHRFGVQAGVRRLRHGRRIARLRAERRRLTRDLGRVRDAYLATHPG